MWKLAVTAVGLGVLACIVLLSTGAFGDWDESKYRSAFLSVTDGEEVSYFLDYEQHKSAGLNLKGDRYLHIVEFDEAVGRATDHIGLYQIGNLTVSCSTTSERNDVVVGAFNILEVMASSPLRLRLRNIGDVVSHYNEIYRYLEESLPAQVTGSKQLNTGSHTYWCSRGWSTKRARN